MNKGCLITTLIAAAILIATAIGGIVIGVFYYVGHKSETVSARPPAAERSTDNSETKDAEGDDSPGHPAERTFGRGEAIPTEAEARQMVNATMLNFKNAVNSGNFETFHRTQLSDLWKREVTAAQLKASFKTFVERKIDLSPIFLPNAQRAMVVDPALYMDKEQLLVIKGYYPVPSEKVNVAYELSYSLEGEWRLSGINVEIKPSNL